jgi:hypothetical protein
MQCGSKPKKQPEHYLNETTVMIDSRDRNRYKYPNSNEFAVYFNGSGNDDDAIIQYELKNIHSIQVVQILLPNSAIGTTGPPYITMEIDEIDDTIYGTNDTLSNAFSYIRPINSTMSSLVVQDIPRVYKTPKATLGKLTFRFREPSGTLFDFGTDTSPPTEVDDTVQVAFILKIKTVETRNRSTFYMT